ncbi:transglutaminase family protein [uncultured Alteromonas sp.]|jgi:transglutaminase-like putative cysteine protease|uniref:transglutaminase-like domain-containing protein n=1 Tax=uncultured Alteromonas sp. TaxID=179113 RepID=UPI0025DACE6D|nr:transglutaminase-like domain-containing protein [uncultured Alteromonas sp.]
MSKLLTTLALTFSLNVSAQSVPSLAEIPLTMSDGQSGALTNAIYLEVETRQPASLVKYLSNYSGVTTEQLNDNTVAVALDHQPRFTGLVQANYAQPSFVIDTDEPATQAFIDGFTKTRTDTDKLEAITAYVSEYISEPTYIHGFNLASTVATQRSGDCTEFATLTTALARGLGLPARLTLGTVITAYAESADAFGHAWTEVWYKGKWQIIDAALYGAEGQQFYYLPTGILDNEGPGFAMSLVMASSLFPNRVINVQNLQ